MHDYLQQCLQEREQAQQEINNDFQNDSQEEIDPLEQETVPDFGIFVKRYLLNIYYF